jgi:glutathione synthase
VTSPTGLQQIARFDNLNLAAAIWEKIEAQRADQNA